MQMHVPHSPEGDNNVVHIGIHIGIQLENEVTPLSTEQIEVVVVFLTEAPLRQ